MEDVEKRVSRYLSTELGREIRQKVSELPTAVLNDKEYVVRHESRKIKNYVPPERVTSLLEEANGRSKKELAEKDPELYKTLERLRLLHLIPAK